MCSQTCDKCKKCSDTCSCPKKKTYCVDDCKGNKLNAKCVVYDTGSVSNLRCFIGAQNKESVHNIFEKLDKQLCNFLNITVPTCARQLLGLPQVADVTLITSKILDFLCDYGDTKVKISASDASSGFLYDKIDTGDCIAKTIVSDPNGNQKVRLSIDFNCLKSHIPTCVEVNCSECTPTCVKPVFGNPTVSCNNNNSVVTVTTISPLNTLIQFSADDGVTWVNGNPNSYTFTFPANGSLQKIKSRVVGCSNYEDGYVQLCTFTPPTPVPTPVPPTCSCPTSVVVNGNSTSLQNTSATYTATVTGGANYITIWSVTGGTITSGQGTSSINVTWGVPGSGIVTHRSFCGNTVCTTTDKNVVISATPPTPVTPTPTPCVAPSNVVLTGDNTASQANTKTYTVSFTGTTNGATYQWSVNNGATIQSGGGTNDTTATIVFNNSGNTVVSCQVNNCGNNSASTKTITVNPTSTCTNPSNVVISKSSQTATTVTMNVNATNGTTFRYCHDNTFTCTSSNCSPGDGSVGGSFTVPVTPGSPQVYTVRVFNTTCSCFTDSTVTITNTTVCTVPSNLTVTKTGQTDSTVTLSVNALNGTTFRYCNDVVFSCNNENCSPGDGVIGGSFTIPLAEGESENYTVRVYNGNSCTCFADINFNVINNFGCTSPSSLTLVKTEQTATTVTVQVNAINGTTFRYCHDNTFTCNSSNCNPGDGNIGDTFTIPVNEGQSVIYTVRVFNSVCGCYSDITRTIINNFPDTCIDLQDCTIN